MEDYSRRVQESYCSGTFRHGPLLQLSMVGQFSEESGGYFPELLGVCACGVWCVVCVCVCVCVVCVCVCVCVVCVCVVCVWCVCACGVCVVCVCVWCVCVCACCVSVYMSMCVYSLLRFIYDIP